MELIYQKEKLKELLKDFHTVAKMRIAVFDSDGEEVAAYPENLCPFCTKVRKDPRILWKCLENDRQALARCETQPEVYQCHMGLMEAAAPIFGENQLLGYIMIGQVCEKGDDLQNIFSCCQKYGIERSEVESELKQNCTLSRREADSAMHLMTACTAYILTQGLIFQKTDTISRRVVRLIDQHYAEKIALDFFCEKLSVSRNYLCCRVKEETGRTVGQLLLEKRIKESKRLLKETQLPISEISNQVGIEDYNYFSKIFRNTVGVTPSFFRNGQKSSKNTNCIHPKQ